MTTRLKWSTYNRESAASFLYKATEDQYNVRAELSENF